MLATVEPRAGAPASSWIRMYFYSYDVTPIQRQMPVTGRDPDLLRNWDGILQITSIQWARFQRWTSHISTRGSRTSREPFEDVRVY